MKYSYAVALVIAASTIAFADNAPLPNGTTSVTFVPITMANSADNGPWVEGSRAANGDGGEFGGSITIGAVKYTTNFWCVDDQAEFYEGGYSGNANITLLSDIPAAQPSGSVTVQYNEQGIVWGNTSLGSAFAPADPSQTLPGDAQARYEMAAYLVSQYPGMNPAPPVIQSGTCVGTVCEEDAIQQAIWDITNNNLAPLGTTPPADNLANVNSIGGNTTVAYWINQALLNYTGVSQNEWAVVSWNASANGVLTTCSTPGCTPGLENQTFLVQIAGPGPGSGNQGQAPEPGFYGVLTIGLTGLFFVGRRRRIRRA